MGQKRAVNHFLLLKWPHSLGMILATNCLLSVLFLMSRFRHPNLLGLMGYCPEPFCLVYPYMHKGSLYDNLHEYKVL